ncbi:MAG: hypothetical protein HKM93_11810 [Desulfobacteraceae bacterium]|nr:hypothetical protein [Desulfobacteraceae bacterium]
MSRFVRHPLMAWAVRDLLQHPVELVITAMAILLITLVLSVSLLVPRALSDTARRILSKSPDLVVRGVNSGIPVPLPVREAVASAKAVPGALNIRARWWGIAKSGDRWVTVVGVDDRLAGIFRQWGVAPPLAGEAVTGRGVTSGEKIPVLHLSGAVDLSLTIASLIPKQLDMISHDTVYLTKDDAASVLGIASGYCSDLAVDVFHENEAPALAADLRQAFPWPVHIVGRMDTAGTIQRRYSRLGGYLMLPIIPAMTVLLIMVGIAVSIRRGRRAEAGLLKALGWTGADILQCQLLKTLTVVLPAVILGSGAAYTVVFQPGMNWAAGLWFGWEYTAPPLYLSASSAGLVFTSVNAIVLLPWLAADLFSSINAFTADPMELIEGAMKP